MEHLMSKDTARRLAAFLRFLDTDSGAADRLLAAWREYDQELGHDPDSCPICQADSITDSIAE
jgi:hypothetical protein